MTKNSKVKEEFRIEENPDLNPSTSGGVGEGVRVIGVAVVSSKRSTYRL